MTKESSKTVDVPKRFGDQAARAALKAQLRDPHIAPLISRNNPDETAKNSFELNKEATIPRAATISWNIVPWYIGDGKRNRSAQGSDIASRFAPLTERLSLLPNFRVVVLVGRKAERAAPRVLEALPTVVLFRSPHPSPLVVNHKPGNG